MKKSSFVVLIVVCIVLIAVVPAWAAGPNGAKAQGQGAGMRGSLPGQQLFALVGIIQQVDGNALTVEVFHGNRFAKPIIGQDLVIQLTESTSYLRWTPAGCVPVAFAEVSEGDTTSVHGTVSDGIFVASRVTVDVPLDCCTP